MPSRPPRPCRARGCRELVQPGQGGYCAEHRRSHMRTDERPSSYARGYTKRWQKIRARVLLNDPICRDPFGIHAGRGDIVPADEVDHITPLAAGGTHDLANLQPLCKSCHSRKTAVESSGWGRGV